MRLASVTALVGMLSIALFSSNALASDWGWGGDCCVGFNSARSVYYGAPTYSYAPPTTTVYPHYVIQPNYIVRQTYVLPEDVYVGSSPAYSLGSGILADQGQYYPGTTIALSGYGGYSEYSYGRGYGYRGYHREYAYRGGYGYRSQCSACNRLSYPRDR
jgi:hypothetical protein